MKKLTALLLSLALALSLCACGGGSPDGDVSGNPSGEDVGESQPGGEVSRNRPGGAPEASTPLPVIGLTYNSESHFDEDLNETMNSMQTALPGVDAETRANYPELAAALDDFRESAMDRAWNDYQQREERLPDFIKLGGNGGDYEMYGNVNSIIRRADAKAVSVVNAVQEYDGGTHSRYHYEAATFDAATGEKITLKGLLTDEGAEMLNARIAEELDTLYPDLTPGENVAEYAPEDYTFSVEPDGVTFWFNPGEIVHSAYGLLNVKLYFIRDDDILNDTYQNAGSSWLVELAEDFYRFTAANGSVEVVNAWDMVNTAANGALTSEDLFYARYNVFYARIPHGDYIVINLEYNNTPNQVFVYRANGELVQCLDAESSYNSFFYPEPPNLPSDEIDLDNYDEYRFCLTNPDDAQLTTYSDVFGSWNVTGRYRLTDSGFQLQDDLLRGDGLTLTAKRDFTVTRCDPDNWLDATDEEITIPEGTEVDVVAVNPEQTSAYFRVTDEAQPTEYGEFIFSLSYDNPGSDIWPHTVDGIPENELFEGLWDPREPG